MSVPFSGLPTTLSALVGPVVYQVTGVPSPGLGINGDFAYRTDSILQYAKVAGVWNQL